MIGVVLWSEQSLSKAVIWCDDQGDLAFYSGADGAALLDLRPGDWVEFDIALSGKFRIANNLRVLVEQGSPGLADQLSTATPSGKPTSCEDSVCKTAGGPADGKGTIVPFPQTFGTAAQRNVTAQRKKQG